MPALLYVQLAAAALSLATAKEPLLPHSHEVSIRFANRHFCLGAIISPRHVLTAAHCFQQRSDGSKYPEPMYGYMSVVSGFNANLSEGGVGHGIRNVTTHADLSYAHQNYWISDIALVTLDAEISYSPLEQPIELPDGDVAEAARAKASVWSSPLDSLRTAEVSLMPHGKCAERLKEKFLGEHDSKVCAYSRAGRGFCLNIDGSPLVQNGKLVGVGSASEGCRNGSPDVYTNVYTNLNFVHKAMAMQQFDAISAM